MVAQKKKNTSKKQIQTKSRARVAKLSRDSSFVHITRYKWLVALVVIIAIVMVAVVYLFVTLASTARYGTLQPVKTTAGAGAHLPINYASSKLTGTVRYASPNGSNTSTCTVGAPCTLARAVSQTTTANSTVVLAGGIYRDQANIAISGSARNGLRLIAEAGSIPELRGSVAVSGTWVTENSYKYIPYVPRAVEAGQNIPFNNTASMTNLDKSGEGRYPDQVWIGNTALRQVIDKSMLADGKFYVDQTNRRLYLTAADSAKPGIETSRPGDGTTNPRDRTFSISSSGVVLEGIRINRYSANGDDYGVVLVNDGAHNFVMQDVELSEAPYEGIHIGRADNVILRNTSIHGVAWQAINANQSDKLLLDRVKITQTDPFSEFLGSPASGALKTSRTRDTKIIGSIIADNNSHGLWFDQSNINMVVDKNVITNNTDTGVFFEISDGLTMTNNYVSATSGQPVKLAGSSGLRLVNNTIVGGRDPIGVYTDGRSSAGCSMDMSKCLPKSGTISSERQGRFASSITSAMDWMPRIDVLVNNIIAYPRANSGGLCGGVTPALCITLFHSTTGAKTTLDQVIHKADPARAIPQTIIDGNVYANGSTRIIRAGSNDYAAVANWTAALAVSPVGIAGLDAKGKSGNSWVNSDGTGTDSLINANKEAYRIPVFTGTNAVINNYIPAGTQQYGALIDATTIPTPTTTVVPTSTSTVTPTVTPTPTPTTTIMPTPTPSVDTQAPTAPSNVRANMEFDAARFAYYLSLLWSPAYDNVGITSYTIKRNGSILGSSTETRFRDYGIVVNSPYFYEVLAADKQGNISAPGSTSVVGRCFLIWCWSE